MTVTTLPKLWSKSEVAEYLGLNCETVARLCRRRRLGFVTIGNKTCFSEEHIQQYIAEREVLATESHSALSVELLPLEELRDLSSADEFEGCGVYFLWNSGVLVYIGQSQFVTGRIRQHRDAGSIDFDRATAMPVNWPDQLAVEGCYIKAYCPPENRRK